MKLLNDYVLIERDEITQEEKRESGLILFKTDFNLYQFDNDQQKVDDIVYKRKQNKGIVIGSGKKCSFPKKGDRVIYKRMTEWGDTLIANAKEHNFVCEKYILGKEINGKVFPAPDYTLVKITKESRDGVFSKKIKRDDGTFVDLFMAVPVESDLDDATKYFVSTGLVISVGRNVKGVEENDIAIINYLCDNDESIIVGYDGEDKIIAVNSVTVRHKDSNVVYASRKNRRDEIVWQVGDYDNTSSLIGVIRGDELISQDPYVFLEHLSNVMEKSTKSGIKYSEVKYAYERKVLGSFEGCPLAKGDTVLIQDADVFEVSFDGKTVTCINAPDVLATVADKKNLQK